VLIVLGVLVTGHALVAGFQYWSNRIISTAAATPSSEFKFEPSAAALESERGPKLNPLKFAEIAQSSGINFVHDSGATADKHFPTAIGSGVAIFDYDGDGKLDLYFATGRKLAAEAKAARSNRLYRNLGNNRFLDVTESSKLGYSGFCHGIVVGDIDNDGDSDVFLCNYGANALYRNNGNGTFDDISRSAGIDRPGWSCSGAFLDYDNDGDLDLYVANYGYWQIPADDVFCGPSRTPEAPGPDKVRLYCSPKSIRPRQHILYRNNGDRTFTDVTAIAGIDRRDGRGMGVVASDLNGDGKIDLYVANDLCPNFLFLNRGDGTFQDVTDTSGAGFGSKGEMRAGMGVDSEDFNGDGRADMLVTNFTMEAAALFVNLGDGQFEDGASRAGIQRDSLAWVGWGCVLSDFDNDGWPDCFIANGNVDDNLHLISKFYNRAPEPALLHRNRNGRRFELATDHAGPYFDLEHNGRGVACGDLDNDGDLDLVVNHKDGPPALLRNDTETRNHWIRLKLEGSQSNRDGVGARVEVQVGERTIVRHRKGGASLGSAHDPRLSIGLGNAESATRVTVFWPSGQVDRFDGLTADADWHIREGATKAERIRSIN
jgi:hypothetical protein